MPTWLYGIYRTGLQFAWAALVTAAAARGFTIPAEAPAWVDEAVFGAVMAVFVGVLQWLETRPADSLLGRGARALAKWLMLGAPKVVSYEKPRDEQLEYLRSTR